MRLAHFEENRIAFRVEVKDKEYQSIVKDYI